MKQTISLAFDRIYTIILLSCLKTISLVLVLALGLIASVANASTDNQTPIADAGLSRYAAQDPLILDGSSSYDPDNSGTLSYAWRQIDGPSVVITDANTATPTISSFVQTEEIQKCEFELVVSDGELASLPDTVEVIIVPDFGASTLRQENPPFDPDKPTILYFGGGDCVNGGGFWSIPSWLSKANLISYPPWPSVYGPDSAARPPTYYKCVDMIIVYLSSVAPDYKQPIQTIGYSTGGQPAIDLGTHLNLTYADARYAINRVTFLDVACRNYASSVAEYLASSVDGEQCWLDAYVSLRGSFHPGVLNVEFPGAGHGFPENWYGISLAGSDMNKFNDGVIAGAYWSVIGPGKNLQLASTPDTQTYKFRWYSVPLPWDRFSGYIDFYDETKHTGRLPESVTLVGPADGAAVDANGVVLSCEESENAVGYQLLFGPDPYHMVYLFSDTPSPPAESVTAFPFEQCWWTVKAYDQYGSTIYADPLRIHAESVSNQTIENVITGQRYVSIQQAINDACPGDEIAVGPGAYQYFENINFKGKNLIVRSTDPNNPDIVTATVINGGHRPSVVTFSGGEEASCLLAGFTITGGISGIYCRDASPTIRNCVIRSNGPNAIEFWSGYEPPTIIDCNITGQTAAVKDPRLIAHWALDEQDGDIAYDSASDCNGTLIGSPIWQPTGGMAAGALSFDGIDDYISTPFVLNPAGGVLDTETNIWVKGGLFNTEANIWVKGGVFSTFAWIKGGEPGQVIISQANGVNWLLADPAEGNLMTKLKSNEELAAALTSNFIITDGLWHRVGIVLDGFNRILYVDGVEAARDTQIGLESSEGGLYFGAGKNLEPGSFFSGLIDDVRIYDRALSTEEIAALSK
jgi:sialidase-1